MFEMNILQDISQFEDGIGPLEFKSLRIISFPGGQQYGAINPCEMNEFSDECDAWEQENGPYVKGDFMVKSNPRTKGRWEERFWYDTKQYCSEEIRCWQYLSKRGQAQVYTWSTLLSD